MGNSTSDTLQKFNTRRPRRAPAGGVSKTSFNVPQFPGLKPFQRKRARPKTTKLRRKHSPLSLRPNYFLQSLVNKPETFANDFDNRRYYDNHATPTDCFEPLNPTGTHTSYEQSPQGNGYSWNKWAEEKGKERQTEESPDSKKRSVSNNSPIQVPETFLEENSFAGYKDLNLATLEKHYTDLVKMYHDEETNQKWAVEKELHKIDRAIKTSPEFKIRERQKMINWENEQRIRNRKCLREMRLVIPSDIHKLSVDDLISRSFNEVLARRFVRTKALHLYHMPHEDILKLYRGDLCDQNGRYTYSGLDIIEMRALYALVSEEVPTNRTMKKWKDHLAQNLYVLTEQERLQQLPERLMRHPSYAKKGQSKRSPGPKRYTVQVSTPEQGRKRLSADLVKDAKKRLSATKLPTVTEENKISTTSRRRGMVEEDDDDDDDDDIEEIKSIVKDLSMHYSDPEELEKALASVFESADDEEEQLSI